MRPDDAGLQSLGDCIRDRRKALGLTQSQLADRLGWVQERISVLETGKYGMPSLPGLARLAEALEIPLLVLLQATGYGTEYGQVDTTGSQTQESAALQYTLQRLLEIDATTVSEALDQASDRIAEAMAADKVDAFMLDPASQTLVALGTSNTPMGRRQHEVGLERQPIANRGRIVEVYERGQVFRSGDVRNDPGVYTGVKETLGVQSMVAVPLRVNGDVGGVLVAESSQQDRFSDEDLRFFQAVARWVGMIARHAQLTETMRRSVARDAGREAADEVITALARDIGTALTPLKGRLDILSRRLGLDELRDAARSVQTVQDMVTRLLDSTRLDHGLFSLAMQPLDLAGLVERVAREAQSRWEGLEIRVSGPLEVEVDPARMTEVLMNVITNAIQHSPDGAPIIVAAGPERRKDEEWAVVSITDEGSGIDSDAMPRLFERARRGKESSGLGLGLYLSRRLVEAQGGTLTLDSSLGRGTTVWIAVPSRTS